jgi:hypothetical protein
MPDIPKRIKSNKQDVKNGWIKVNNSKYEIRKELSK